MKVLHVIPSVSPLYGGPSRAIVEISETLNRIGIEVDIATTTGHGSKELKVPLDQPVNTAGINYFYFKRQTPKVITFSIPLFIWLYKHLTDYEIIHIHSLFNFPSLAASTLARLFKIPYVIRPVGTLDAWSLKHKNWKKKPYYLFVEKNTLKHSSAIHATSIHEFDNINKLGFGLKTSIIPLGINLPTIKRNLKDSIYLKILFLSRLHPVKNIPLLLQSLNILLEKNIKFELTIAGDGEITYKKRLINEIENLGIKRYINFVGFANGNEKRELMLSSNVFVLPSYQENFGIAVAEAMSYGLAVIVSDQVALSKEIEKNESGIVVPTNDPHKLAEAFIFLNDIAIRNKIGENARLLIKREFCTEKMGKGLVNLYQKIINKY